MDLHKSRVCWNKLRHDGMLKRSGGDDDVLGLDCAFRGFDTEAGPPDIPSHLFHLNPAADGGGDHLGVRDEIISDLLLACARAQVRDEALHIC